MSEPLARIKRYEDLGLGLFIHWGLYSQLAVGEWTEFIHHRSRSEYEKLIATLQQINLMQKRLPMLQR